jgi:hypothetical protein
MANTKPSDSILFPISEMDKGIADLIPQLPAPPKWPAFNALNHLNRAWKIREIDPHMAIFRSITAEEEAATALFLSLKRRHYIGSDKLKQRDHMHKNAVIPFFSAISRVLVKVKDRMPKFELILDTNNRLPLLQIRFNIIHPITGEPSMAYPDPPLHFSLLGGRSRDAMKTEDFSLGIDEIVTSRNVKSIIEHIKNRANLRNQVLYAGANGYPMIGGDIEKGLLLYQKNVFFILRIYLLIDPYPMKQLFVQQALYAYLKTLKLLPADFKF